MKYTTPEMEIVRFEVEDVIVASGACVTDCDVYTQEEGND